MTPLLKYNGKDFFELKKDEARLILDWFERDAVGRCSIYDEELALAGALYKFRGQQPPPRLRPFIPTDLPQTLPAGQMHRWLLEHNYTPDDSGVWVAPDVGLDFQPGMWQYCGGTDTGGFKWLPEWFVQKED